MAEFIHVIDINNAGDLALVKSILDGSGIEYYIDGENFSQTYGYATPAKVRVAASQVEEAQDLLADFK